MGHAAARAGVLSASKQPEPFGSTTWALCSLANWKRLQLELESSNRRLQGCPAVPSWVTFEQVLPAQEILKPAAGTPSEHATLPRYCQGKEHVKRSATVSAGKYFDTLSKILICFSFSALGLEPVESKLAVLISDPAPFSRLFFFLNSGNLSFKHLKCL